MSDLRENLINEFQDPDYRYGYAESFLNTKIATQIKTLREQRGKKQAEIGALIGTKQSGFSRFEDVNHSVWKTDTLWKIARALDVRLDISFKTFGSLMDDKEQFNKESLECPDFKSDPAFKDSAEAILQRPSHSLLDVLMAARPELAVALSGAGDSMKALHEASLAATAYCEQIATQLTESMKAFHAAISGLGSNAPLVRNQVQARVPQNTNPGVIKTCISGQKVRSIATAKGWGGNVRGRRNPGAHSIRRRRA